MGFSVMLVVGALVLRLIRAVPLLYRVLQSDDEDYTNDEADDFCFCHWQ